jgi:cbb3-type cytochrome oxidase cytochrome c subunit
MIRPVVADVGLGPVTLNDTDQVLGTRRFGPDLAEVGARLSELQLQAVVQRSATHPTYHLSNDDLSDLTAYLLESTTSTGGG